jgi:hemolysin activation/secretion protein
MSSNVLFCFERRALVLLFLLSIGVTTVQADEPEIPEPEAAPVQTEAKIAIRRFVVTGSSRFGTDELNRQLQRFVGRNRTKADVESAREALERFFHEQGYGEATVRIVEPAPAKSTIALEVNENRPAAVAAVKEPKPTDSSDLSVAEQLDAGKPVVVAAVEKLVSAPPAALVGKPDVKGADEEFLLEEPVVEKGPQEGTFTIKGFIVEGTWLFPQEELQKQIRSFVGRGKTAADVEGARDALERYFHDQGYPAMLVNIPAQSSSNRIFRLEVIENRIGTVLISGNRWFSTEKILRDIPSILPGKALQLKDLQSEINAANRNPDFKAIPEMQPGKTPGTIDLALKVEEKLPLHGSLELNNRASHDTTALRLNAALRYDNLWQRDHSISVQYQISPQDPDEVEVISGSYTLPTFWNREDKLVVYGVVSNSNTNAAAGFSNLGKGNVVGSRLIMPLQGSEGFFHTAVAGFDYKDFSETVGVAGAPGVKTPITYFPVSASYSAYLRDDSGLTAITGGVAVTFRGAVSDPRQFDDKRYKARSNYLTVTAGLERNQQLPGGFTLLAKLDGQLSDQPLISNEQYSAGGVESVRGYRDSEASGDNAIHGVIELGSPELLRQSCKERFTVTPYIFYDMAHLGTREPLPGQDWSAHLQGIGIGMRGTLLKDVDFQTDLGFPLRDNSRTTAGEPRLHFKVRYQF